MSNSLHVPWIKPVILALLNPLVPLPKPPPLQISDYTSTSSSSSSSSSPPRVVLILSDARHRIQAHLSPSALSAHSTPLSLLRGAIITLTRHSLSYVLDSAGTPGSPLNAGDEFILQVDGFEVVGKGGSGEVGHPISCMQDREVRDSLQKMKDIELDSRRRLVTSNQSTLFPNFNPSHTSAATTSSSSTTLPPSAHPALPAELALYQLSSVSAYLQSYSIPPQSQAALDLLEPGAPSEPEVEDVELLNSQWSSSREEEEKVIFSQLPPIRSRIAHPVTRPVVGLTTANATHPIPPRPSSSSSSTSSPPMGLLPRLPLQSFLCSETLAPELPRLSPTPSPPRSQAPFSPRPDDFYATQAPLSFISPPLSPASPSSMEADDSGGSHEEVDMKEEKGSGEAKEDMDAAAFSLSQHNLPLSTFDIEAMREEEDQEDGKEAADPSSQALHDKDADDLGGIEEMTDPSPPEGDFLTQGPMLSEEQSQESSSSPSLSLPPPSYSSSMPPLSPGTPSPQKTPPVQRNPPLLRGLPSQSPPISQSPIEVKRERREEVASAAEEAKAAADDQFSAESIQQRQQQRNQQLLNQRRGQQGSVAQKRRSASDGHQSGGVEDVVVEVDAVQRKRQRMVRFSDERKVEEVKDEEEDRGRLRGLSQLDIDEADVERLHSEPRAVYTQWTDVDYQIIVSYWRSAIPEAPPKR